MIKIRLARHGSKKRPYYHIVAADARAPRDGKFLEKIGTYNPMVAKDHADRLKMDGEKLKVWLDKGAQPTERVSLFMAKLGLGPKVEFSVKTKQHLPKAKAQQRLKDSEDKKKAAEEAKKEAELKVKEEAEAKKVAEAEAKAAPVEEVPVEEKTAE
ncbi:MAG: 30S ribosomal protein S16 [Alphaproteobacteria bacterium]|nr:30S ribosomal protein S16 [Alphaproteobacteria bacterium]